MTVITKMSNLPSEPEFEQAYKGTITFVLVVHASVVPYGGGHTGIDTLD